MPGQSNNPRAFSSGNAYISISDTANYLGVTTRTVRQMIADGRLTGYRLGARVVRLRRDEIDAALQPFGGAA
jgi:excisionase family DNA binding protein